MPEVDDALGAIKALFTASEERSTIAKKGVSIPKEWSEQHAIVTRFLAPLFPPTRPGAGFPQHVQVWLGRIPIHRLAAFVREAELGAWTNGKGDTLTWRDLKLEARKRVVVQALNEMEGQL